MVKHESDSYHGQKKPQEIKGMQEIKENIIEYSIYDRFLIDF